MKSLADARILITNDDGIHAPGLQILKQIAQNIAKEVWVVAPATEQSATGHSLTLRRPLRIHRHDERTYSVDGTPTDCVLLAINEIMKDHQPDLVLSGVNRGGNLGEDITYSGTVAAAMEATLLGYKAIALSQYFENPDLIYWDNGLSEGPELIKKLWDTGWPDNVLINMNFAACPPDENDGFEMTCQGRRKIGDELARGTDPRGEPYYWIGALRTEEKFKAGTDLNAVMSKKTSITPISLDFTDRETLARLQEALS